jgi:hypothetical protein
MALFIISILLLSSILISCGGDPTGHITYKKVEKEINEDIVVSDAPASEQELKKVYLNEKILTQLKHLHQIL